MTYTLTLTNDEKWVLIEALADARKMVHRTRDKHALMWQEYLEDIRVMEDRLAELEEDAVCEPLSSARVATPDETAQQILRACAQLVADSTPVFDTCDKTIKGADGVEYYCTSHENGRHEARGLKGTLYAFEEFSGVPDIPQECDHNWIDPSNSVVCAGSWRLCLKCNELRDLNAVRKYPDEMLPLADEDLLDIPWFLRRDPTEPVQICTLAQQVRRDLNIYRAHSPQIEIFYLGPVEVRTYAEPKV